MKTSSWFSKRGALPRHEIIYNFINERGGRTVLNGFANPPNEFASLEQVFEQAYKHEQFVTQRIYKLMDPATEEKEHATISFLKWFFDEQVEEETTINGILKKVQRFGEDGSGIMMLDNELTQRAFTPPAEAKK